MYYDPPPDPAPAVAWRGATVLGVRAAEGLPVLESVWTTGVRLRFPDAPDLPGWRLVLHDRPIPAPPDARCGERGCGARGIRTVAGLTSSARREIHLSWGRGRIDLTLVAAWELCNAVRPDADDRGCS